MDLKGNDEIIKTFNENLVGGRQPEIQYCWISYSVSLIITYPSKELGSKIAQGEVGVSLSW